MRSTFYITITGTNEIATITVKETTLAEVKKKAFALSKLLDEPKTMSIFDDQNAKGDRSKVYEYLKRD